MTTLTSYYKISSESLVRECKRTHFPETRIHRHPKDALRNIQHSIQ